MGGRLIEIRTQDENDRAHILFGDSPFWLGANDKQEEGHWVWESNQEDVNLNEFWFEGRPSDNSQRNCLILFPDRGMFDYICSDRFNSFCDMK